VNAPDVHVYLVGEHGLEIEFIDVEDAPVFYFDGLEDMQVWCAKMLEAATLSAYGVKGGTA